MRVVYLPIAAYVALGTVNVTAATTATGDRWSLIPKKGHNKHEKRACSIQTRSDDSRRHRNNNALLAFGLRRSKSRASSEDTVTEAVEAVADAIAAENEALEKKNAVYESDTVDAAASQNPLVGIANSVKEGLITFKRGTTGLITNYKTSREIRSRVKAGQELTYGEHAHLARGKQDRNKLISFALLWGLAPEMAPMMVIYFPAMAPSTFERPDAVEVKYRRFSLLRIKATLGGLTQFEEDLLKKGNKRADKQAAMQDQMAEARKVLEAKGKRELFERFQSQMTAPEPQTKKEAKLAAQNVVADIPAPVIKGLGKGMGMAFPLAPAFYIRPKLREYVKELGEADAVLGKQPLDTLSESELHEACNARGMEIAGRSAGELKSGLAEWLKLTSGPIGSGAGAQGVGEGMVFVPERARMLALGLNFLETAREGRQAELSRKALLG